MKIERLSTSVVNRIAAGEIIHYPYNVVKEMTENSLDAGSTYIEIELVNSGIRSIKIIDNGKGIKLDDMPLVCERYATSKLKEFKDLLKLETFGFRGEALSSISQISNITLVSKLRDNPYGYQAAYRYGKMLTKPKLCASNDGTIISVQNLFENTPIRKKALRSLTEEYHQISDVIKKYAIHNPTVRFTLKKESNTEISTQPALSQLDRIQQVYGASVSSSLKTIEYGDSKCQFKILSSDTSHPNYGRCNKKACIFILFVNDRLVDNKKIKKEMKQVYTGIASGINFPFIYISLKVEPSHVDVNIHPTKNEVHLLNEDEITDKITTALSANLCSPTGKKKTPVRLPEKATLNHYFKPAPVDQTPNTETDSSSSVLGTPPPTKGKINHYFKNVRAEKETLTANNPHSSNGLSGQRAFPIALQSTGLDEVFVTHQVNRYFKNVNAKKATSIAANNCHNGNSLSSQKTSPITFLPTGMNEGSAPHQDSSYSNNMSAEEEMAVAENNRNGNSLPGRRVSPIDFQSTGIINENSAPRQRASTTSRGNSKTPSSYQRISSTPLQRIDINRMPEISVSYPSKPLQQEVAKRQVGVNLRKSNPVAPIATKVTLVPTVAETTLATKETVPPITEEPNLEREDLQDLDSIVTIKSEIEQAENKSLSKMFARNRCVGIIDDVLVILSYRDRFYLLNYNTVSEEYFYQLALYNLGRFGKLFFSSPIPIKPCISLFIPNATHQELDTMIGSLLCHKDLLQSYYNIEIDLSSDNNTVQLVCLPMLLVNYTPSFDKLPIFLHNIATEIEWDNEIECLDALAREISSLYCGCSMNQCTSFLQSARNGNFKAPRYLSEKGYITELNFPDEILA